MNKIDQLRKDMLEDLNDVYFTYKGKRCGFEIETKNGKRNYAVWYGMDDEKNYADYDEAINDKFFDGKSIVDLLNADAIEIEYV